MHRHTRHLFVNRPSLFSTAVFDRVSQSNTRFIPLEKNKTTKHTYLVTDTV